MLMTLLRRPIAVTMCIIALSVMGLLSLRYVAVSLMPDIDIPQITVQVSMPGYTAQEIEHNVVSSLRGRLMQVAGITDIRSEARMDAGSVRMTFEPGSNIDLLFIEVNEKIDRAMNNMPKEMERPKVVKASVMDVPAFYLDIYMKNGKDGNALSIAQLGRFVRSIVSKRIEQLPQTAMVDISGTVGTEIDCIPDYEKLASIGMTVHDIEKAINQNNLTLETLSVRDGIYRYNIHFDSQLLTKDDVANIYLKHEGRLLQLKDLCKIEERVSKRNGMVKHNGRDAVTMAIIKQNDARMEDLQTAMDELLEDMRREYPDVEFNVTRDQTRLLAYTIQNLKINLLVGALLACVVLFLFMGRWRLSVLVAVPVPLSLILTLLAFYVCGITINIISLSGLILGVGMIVDNSIIVIDNIMQHLHNGEPLQDAVVRGTKEVVSPMVSSVLTTCSVFIPLIFLSGTAGALFFDQAMGVTFALFASLLVAIVVLPVYFFAFFRKRESNGRIEEKNNTKISGWLVKPYEIVMRSVLRHGKLSIGLSLMIIPLTMVLFAVIEKERMPGVPQEDALVYIDWNQGITSEEDSRRVEEILLILKDDVEAVTSMVGTQEFLLLHTKDITSSEAIIYLKCRSEDIMKSTKEKISAYLQNKYPNASVEYGEPGNIYDLIFSTDEADLNIHLQTQHGQRPEVAATRGFIDSLRAQFPTLEIMPVVTEANIRYVADAEKMAMYKVSYEALHGRLKELMSHNRIFDINDGAQSVPVLVGKDSSDSNMILEKTVANSEGIEIPISYLVDETHGEDYKRLQASAGGEYYCISINANDKEVRKVMDYVVEYTHRPKSELSASFSGGYFSARDMINELSIVLLVALALLYFILAAQFESLIQPSIILLEMVIDVFFVLLGLFVLDESLNIMSMIGIVVMSGIVINDSILKIDTINHLRRSGYSLTRAIWLAGHKRLRPIVMTSLTTILALLPFLTKGSMGSALQYPLSLSLIIGMTAGTLVSLFFVPLLYNIIYKRHQ